MSYEVFYSLRLSEVIDFIEENNKRRQDEHDLYSMYYGQVCATIANFSQGKKRKKYKAGDFFKVKKKKKDQTADEQANYLLMLTMALGGSIEGW